MEGLGGNDGAGADGLAEQHHGAFLDVCIVDLLHQVGAPSHHALDHVGVLAAGLEQLLGAHDAGDGGEGHAGEQAGGNLVAHLGDAAADGIQVQLEDLAVFGLDLLPGQVLPVVDVLQDPVGDVGNRILGVCHDGAQLDAEGVQAVFNDQQVVTPALVAFDLAECLVLAGGALLLVGHARSLAGYGHDERHGEQAVHLAAGQKAVESLKRCHLVVFVHCSILSFQRMAGCFFASPRFCRCACKQGKGCRIPKGRVEALLGGCG